MINAMKTSRSSDFYKGVLRAVSLMVIAYGIYEAVIGYMQLSGVFPSGNSRFPVTGSFFNPGPYCAFLACVLPLAADAVISRRGKVPGIIGWSYIIFAVSLMPVLMGRTGWIAAAAGVVFVWLRADGNLSKIKEFCRRRFQWVIAGGILLIALMTLFYFLKPASASGRLFLWMVGIDAWLDHPWTGVGWEKVAGEIGMAQERYFAAHPDSIFAAVAGCPEYAFNEYIQIAIAFGFGGMLLFVTMMVAGIIVSAKSRVDGVAGGWIAFAIVCMASYPLQFAEFRWLIVAFSVMTTLAYRMDSRSGDVWKTALAKGILCISFIISGWLMTHEITRPDERSRDYFETGKALRRSGKFEESNKVFNEGLSFSSDPMFLNLIGRNMQDMGRNEEAERYFLRSMNRLPSRLYPRYLLAKLYVSPAYFSPEKFHRIYEESMNLEIKVSSPAVSDMQRELRHLNDSIQCLRLGLKSKR